jgi:hypothetical protein
VARLRRVLVPLALQIRAVRSCGYLLTASDIDPSSLVVDCGRVNDLFGEQKHCRNRASERCSGNTTNPGWEEC